jgi:hypothetical protein
MKHLSIVMRGLALAGMIGMLGLGAPERLAAMQTIYVPASFHVYFDHVGFSPYLPDRITLCKEDFKEGAGITALVAWNVRDEIHSAMPIIGQQVHVTGVQHGTIQSTAVTSGARNLSPPYTRPGGYGFAHFTYVPTSDGDVDLEFSADIPETPGSSRKVRFTYPLPFEVKSCAVSVNMFYNLTWPVDVATVYGTGVMDEVAVEADEDGNLHGEGALVYTQIITGLPACSVTWSSMTSAVTITGQVEDDQIGLNFNFGDATFTATTVCPVGGGTGSSTVNPSSAFASSLTFPTEGGVLTYPSPIAGGGIVTVIVTREEDEEAVSDAASQALAALSAWFAAWPGELE